LHIRRLRGAVERRSCCKNSIHPRSAACKQGPRRSGHGAARGQDVVHQPYAQPVDGGLGGKTVPHVAPPCHGVELFLFFAGHGPGKHPRAQRHTRKTVQRLGQLVRLIIPPAAQMVRVLRHGDYYIRARQAADGIKKKPAQQRGKVQMPVKFESQQGMAQGTPV